jgi:hypothetical protein
MLHLIIPSSQSFPFIFARKVNNFNFCYIGMNARVVHFYWRFVDNIMTQTVCKVLDISKVKQANNQLPSIIEKKKERKKCITISKCFYKLKCIERKKKWIRNNRSILTNPLHESRLKQNLNIYSITFANL